MEKPVHMIGLDVAELEPVRLLVSLLRHPDSSVGELTRQALFYLQDRAATRGRPDPDMLDCAG